MTVHNHSRIAPFGHLRVKGHLHLTAAFRSLSRPSSADIAKASTVCSYYLNLCKIHTLTFLASQDASASCCLKDSPSVRQKTFRVKYFFRFLLLYSFQRTDFLIKDQDGGDEENRTPDPLLARQVLSQLSYTPKLGLKVVLSDFFSLSAFAPAFPSFSYENESQLSYTPKGDFYSLMESPALRASSFKIEQYRFKNL